MWLEPSFGRFTDLPSNIRRMMARYTPRIRFAVTATELPRMKPRIFHDSEITWQHLAASCALPFALPQVRIQLPVFGAQAREAFLGLSQGHLGSHGLLLLLAFAFKFIGGVSRLWLIASGLSTCLWLLAVRLMFRHRLETMLRSGYCLDRALLLCGSMASGYAARDAVEVAL